MFRNAQIVGKVEYRQGDGANLVIRPGPCQVDETGPDATLSWTDGESHANATMPIASLRRYVAAGAIRFDAQPAA